MLRFLRARSFAVSLICIVQAGCGTMSDGRGWGQDATLTPGWGRIGQAALNALTAPETWAPAAGALAFQVGHADRNVQEWAAKNTPFFGSQRNAAQMSDNFLTASGAIWAISGAAAPSGDESGAWTLNKVKGFGVETGGGLAALGITGILKDAADRTRPNSRDTDSFPSRHAAGASLFMTFASRHVDTYGWSGGAAAASRIAFATLTAATAWARVEANEHFPSDVLAGIAIGHYTGAFFTGAFIGRDNPRNAMFLVQPSREGAMAMVRFDF